jgi:hypothetical protein
MRRDRRSGGMRFRTALVALGAVIGLMAFAPGAWAYTCGPTLDNFDRGDSPTLGTNWTQQAPTMSLIGQRAANPNGTAGLATFNPLPAATEACVDVNNGGTGLEYGGMVLKYGSLTQNYFVKVQKSTGANFTTAFFYLGNNGAATPTPSTVTLVPFSSARLHVLVTGKRLTLDIDKDLDGTPEQSFGSDYPTPAGLGTKVGLVSYGGSRLDNFRGPPAVPGKPAPKSPGGGLLSKVSLSPARFKAARSGPAVGAAQTGTKVSYTVSAPASVRFTVQRRAKGKRVNGKCVRPKRSNRRKRTCVRYVNVAGSITQTGKVGANSFTFRGRIGGSRLAVARYRLVAQAKETAATGSVAKNPKVLKAFRIVRR